MEGLTENFEVEVRASGLRYVVVRGAAAQLGASQGPRDAGGGEGGDQEGGRGHRHRRPQHLSSSRPGTVSAKEGRHGGLGVVDGPCDVWRGLACRRWISDWV